MKFDYLQLRTEAQYIKIDESKFDVLPKEETSHGLVVKRLSVKSRNEIKDKFDIPANRIKVSITGPYVSLGLTSKVLGKNYKELITGETISDCLEGFVKHGVLIDIDSKAIRDEAKVTVAEITKDLIISRLLSRRDYEIFSQAVFNPYRWTPMIWDNGFGLRKQVKEDKELLSIYNKAQEVGMLRMKNFMDRYLPNNPYKDEKCLRAEARLLSSKSIRKHFGGNRVDDLLEHEENTLQELFKKAFIKPSSIVHKKLSKSDKKNILLAKQFNYDTKVIANYISDKNKHNRARMYRDVMESIMIAKIMSKDSLNVLEEIISKI